jgi:hypothetical protein
MGWRFLGQSTEQTVLIVREIDANDCLQGIAQNMRAWASKGFVSIEPMDYRLFLTLNLASPLSRHTYSEELQLPMPWDLFRSSRQVRRDTCY